MGTTDVISSAMSYIPEQVWNDSAPASGSTPATISAGGGGVSTFTSRPSWQTGVTGIPSGTFRLVPDISLTASPENAGYIYCSSDSSTKVTGSCANGFRDSNSQFLTVAGGTSFGAPVFAGMMALINQKTNSLQGVANSKLYTLASDTATYSSAFHDITNGNNNCSAAGTTLCPSTTPAATNYAATTGYDLATGLGSINFNSLLTAWSGSTSAKSFTLAAANATVAVGSTGSSTITITPQNGYTGTITWTVSSSPSSTDLCFSMPDASVSGTTAAMLSIKTTASACSLAKIIGTTDNRRFAALSPPASYRFSRPLGLVLIITVGAVLLVGYRSRNFALAGFVLLLVVVGLATAGCSSTSKSSSSSSSGTAAKGTYIVTIVGKDATTSSISTSTSMTLTIN